MFVVIRLIISISIMILNNYVFKKISFKERVPLLKFLFNMIIVSTLLVVLSFCPFENLVATFNTPTQVFKYVNPNAQEVRLVVSGNESDLVIAEDNASYIYLIVPKNKYGWKIGIPQNTNRIAQKIHNDITIYVYQYNDTQDFFITVTNVAGGSLSINDIYDSKFYSLEQENKSLNKTFVTYFAFVSNYDSDYSIMVDGKNINIKNKMTIR